MKIYIAGAIARDPDYRAKFQRAADMLIERGHIPLNPAVLPEGLSEQFYMTSAITMINEADAVLALPDWQNSKGAWVEYVYCQKISKAWGEDVMALEAPML